MLKLIVFSAVVASALGSGSNEKIYSFHTLYTPTSMNLTVRELKLFSGNAMNMIRAKCPKVDDQKIFKVQKYIGKLLAKREPLPGASKEFPSLLNTLTACTKEGVVAKPVQDEPIMDVAHPPAGFFPFFSPFHTARKVIIHRIPADHSTEVVPEVQSEAAEIPTEPRITGPPPFLDIAEEPSDSSASPPRVITTTIFVRPQDMKEGIRTSGGFFNWINGLFSRVSGFFKRVFPFGHRSKRDLTEVEAEAQAPVVESKRAPYQLYSTQENASKGKTAFGALIDQMCRIYCDTCQGEKDMHKFKMAGKQLLDDLFEEDSGLDAAAEQFLDDDFLTSLRRCE